MFWYKIYRLKTLNTTKRATISDGIAFSGHQDFFEKISEFAFRYFMEHLNADNITVNGDDGKPKDTSLFLEQDEILVLLKGFENAKRSGYQKEIPYEIWKSLYALHYEWKHWSNFTRTYSMVTINDLMWRNIQPEAIHKLMEEKIAYQREEEGYDLLMELAVETLRMPAGWLKNLYPYKGERPRIQR